MSIARGLVAVGLLLSLAMPAFAESPLPTSVAASAVAETAKPSVGRVTGLPLPRFVSLRSRAVNLRVGPGKKYKIAWLYRRAGLPVEVVQEYDRWRRIRDADGTEGWVMHSLLTRRRTGLVEGLEPVAARSGPRAEERTVARLEPGVLVSLRACDARWCRVDVKGHSGFVPKTALWGVYRAETIED